MFCGTSSSVPNRSRCKSCVATWVGSSSPYVQRMVASFDRDGGGVPHPHSVGDGDGGGHSRFQLCGRVDEKVDAGTVMKLLLGGGGWDDNNNDSVMALLLPPRLEMLGTESADTANRVAIGWVRGLGWVRRVRKGVVNARRTPPRPIPPRRDRNTHQIRHPRRGRDMPCGYALRYSDVVCGTNCCFDVGSFTLWARLPVACVCDVLR
jgi:hypothetical protein